MIKPGMFISDRYELIEKVGTGGMADVYKAKCHRLNRFVAIKILKPEYSDDQTFVNKFRREAQSAAGLSHPNIVNVYDVGDDGNLHYIVMELIEGITLKSFIERKGKLEIKEAVGIAIQIAQGMEAAHTNHIIHRDIKPQNIIISREGKVKVTDFGIAKATSSNTITSNAMGSVHYISPEQARGGYSDEKSDIYSLGVTLYEMLVGKVPFEGDNAVSVALLHIQEEVPSVRAIDPTIPLSLDKIVEKCMQKKPEFRYPNASELIRDLKRSLSNPDGEYIKVIPAAIADSSTISFTKDQVGEIREAANASVRANASVNKYGNKPNQEEVEDDSDDLDEADMDPKLDKAIMFGSITVCIILVLVIIFVVGKAFGLFKFNAGNANNNNLSNVERPNIEDDEPVEDNAKVEVPDVKGYTLDEAIAKLKEVELSSRTEQVASAVIPKDHIISQSIEPGTQVDKTEVILLTVSTGEEKFELRDVTNLTQEQADTILENDQELKVTHEYEYSDTIAADKVIRTNPKAKTPMSKGDKVTVYISKGKEIKYAKVPDIKNYTQKQAEELLTSNGLKVGKVSAEYSDHYEKGVVISQSYEAGKELEQGTKVDFSVSLGKKPVDEPVVEEPKYLASVALNKSPFADDMEEGVISFDVYYDDADQDVIMDAYTATLTAADFPKVVTISGPAGGKAMVMIYLNDEQIEEQEVTFRKANE